MTWKEAVGNVFANKEDEMFVPAKIKNKLWQLMPSLTASLACIPFGLMLGWPSPSNPLLIETINKATEIPITIDQSAMVAGFLMIGNTIGSPISPMNGIRAKYGIMLGVAIMISGWVVMWVAANIYGLLGSRFLVGFGHGYVAGQVKIYIREMTDMPLRDMLIKQINLHTFFALIIVYSYGGFVTFRQTSIISFAISVSIFFLMVFLPSTPKDLVKANKSEEAKKLLTYIKPNVNPSDEIKNIGESIIKVPTPYGLCDLFKILVKDTDFRMKFLLFLVLVFCQQGSGLPATIIYTQILFTRSKVPNPEYIAIGYVIVYFLANVIGIYISPKYNKRTMLFFSSISVSAVLVVKILLINFQVNENYWSYASVPVMYTYLILHTIGLGNIPITLINDFFPLDYRNSVIIFFIMLHSMLALIITKIFQVLITKYLLDTPFYLFLSFSLIAAITVFYFLLPEKTEEVKKIEISTKT